MITGQFNDSFPPIMDGVANVVKNYTYWLNKKYGQSYAVTPFVPEHIDDEEFKVYRYKSIPLFFRKPYRIGLPGFSVKVRNDLEKIDFDLIHVHSPFSSGAFAKEIAKKKKVPLIATFHSKLYDDFKQELKFDNLSQLALGKAMDFYNMADYVWTVNKGTVKTMREYGYKGRVDVVPNGTDFIFPNDYEKRRRKIDHELNLEKNELVLLYVGQIIWQKNLKMVLDVIAKLKHEQVKFKMLVVGEGKAKAEFLNLVNHYKINDYVKYLGKIEDRDYLKSIYARGDMLIFPSIYDNASIVVKEAAALKCAPLLIKGSNTAEGVVHNENGFLCENEVDCITNQIKEVSNHIEHIYHIGENAHNTLYRSWESIVDEVHEKYNEILADIKIK